MKNQFNKDVVEIAILDLPVVFSDIQVVAKSKSNDGFYYFIRSINSPEGVGIGIGYKEATGSKPDYFYYNSYGPNGYVWNHTPVNQGPAGHYSFSEEQIFEVIGNYLYN